MPRGFRKGTLLTDNKKVCVACSQEKFGDSFVKDKSRTDGLSHTCKECRWDQQLRRQCGITAADYLRLYQEQGGKYDICQRDANECKVKGIDRLKIRKDEETNSYRLICHSCSMRAFGPNNRKCTLAKDGAKKCSICQKEKTVDEFRKDVYRKDGYASRCKECDRVMHLRSSYGISTDDYEKMVERQENRCDCCRLTKEECNHPPDKPWFVDHCHQTGNVRGLVCHSCNILIGWSEVLKNMVNVFDYLQRYNTQTQSESLTLHIISA